MVSPLPLQPSRQLSHREARPPLPRPRGPFFPALRASQEPGCLAGGCGDSRVEARVAPGTVPQSREGAVVRGESCGDWLKGN